MDSKSEQQITSSSAGEEPRRPSDQNQKNNSKSRAKNRTKIVKSFDREKLDRGLLSSELNEGEWVNNKKYRPSRGTKITMLKTNQGSTFSVEAAAIDLGLGPGGLWPDPPIVDQPLNLASENTRREFVERLADGLILPESVDVNGKLVRTEVILHLRNIVKHSAALYNYQSNDPDLFIQHVAGILKRDSFICQSGAQPGAYYIRVLSQDECDKDIQFRVDIEMLFATPRILLAQLDPSVRESLIHLMDQVLRIAPSVLHRGRGFRNLDQRFHCLWAGTKAGREIMLKTIESSDYLYLRWRFLNKVYLGDRTPEYVQEIKQFNEKRLKELIEIRTAIADGKGPDDIKKILTLHAQPALWLLRRCEELMVLIKHRERHCKPLSELKYDPSSKG